MGRAAHGGTQMSIWTDDAVRVYVIALVVAVAHDHEYGIEQLVDRLGVSARHQHRRSRGGGALPLSRLPPRRAVVCRAKFLERRGRLGNAPAGVDARRPLHE